MEKRFLDIFPINLDVHAGCVIQNSSAGLSSHVFKYEFAILGLEGGISIVVILGPGAFQLADFLQAMRELEA